jgi:hypothetical protein
MDVNPMGDAILYSTELWALGGAYSSNLIASDHLIRPRKVKESTYLR